MASIGSNHKRKRRSENDTKTQYKHKNHNSGHKSSKQAAKSLTSSTKSSRSPSSSSSNSRPTWVPTKDTYPWNTSTAIYGNCTNVSSRYEKIGRIGEGTYGKFLWYAHSSCAQLYLIMHIIITTYSTGFSVYLHNSLLSYMHINSWLHLHYTINIKVLYIKRKINNRMK